jgi:hypothetical protein
MKATQVYSWRVEQHIKQALESAARAERMSVASLLARIVRDWLRDGYGAADDQAAQRRVREEAAKYLGSVCGGVPSRAAEASAGVKRVIREKHARRRTH